MQYRFRRVEKSDFPRMIELFQEFAEFEKLPEAMFNSVDRMDSEKEYFNAIVVIDPSNVIIGYVAYFICYHTWVGKTMFMDDLYIQPDHRGQGLGSILVNKMITLAKSENCHKLKWQVSRWNTPAIDFYKKLGTEITDVEVNCDLLLNTD